MLKKKTKFGNLKIGDKFIVASHYKCGLKHIVLMKIETVIEEVSWNAIDIYTGKGYMIDDGVKIYPCSVDIIIKELRKDE